MFTSFLPLKLRNATLDPIPLQPRLPSGIPVNGFDFNSHLGGIYDHADGWGRGCVYANPHLAVAGGLYALIAVGLLGLTVLYRRRFRPVVFHCLSENQVWIDGGHEEIALTDVAEVRQSLGTFFGRTVRRTAD